VADAARLLRHTEHVDPPLGIPVPGQSDETIAKRDGFAKLSFVLHFHGVQILQSLDLRLEVCIVATDDLFSDAVRTTMTMQATAIYPLNAEATIGAWLEPCSASSDTTRRLGHVPALTGGCAR
jgi:hypothetical protein